PTHWALMKERLEAVFALRVYILRSKIFEATLLLLALVALLQVLPGGMEWPSNQLEPSDRPIAAIDRADLNIVSVEESQATGAQPITSPAPKASNPQAEADVATADKTVATAGNMSESGAKSSAVTSANEATGNFFGQASINVLPTLSATVASLQTPKLTLHAKSSFIKSTGLQAVQVLPTATVGLVESTAATSLDIATKPVKALVKKGLRVGIIGSFDYNTIHSPFDEVFNIGPRTTDSIGMGYGLAFGYRINRWEIEMGALYSTKNYRPLVPVQQYGTFDYLVVEEFEGIHLEELEVPLNVRFNLNPKGLRWHMYAVGGLTTNLVLKPIYQIRQAELLSKELAAAPAPSKAEREEEVQERSLLNDKKFVQGLLEGGALRDNIYFSYNFGLGLERNIDERWSLFVEPTFINQLRISSGVGPNNDRFSKFALRFGTKVQVWGK
ncbi:MAG: hypothetical protein KDC44_14290, partial [Phaeodactylibacter sp.]|nr:hypothetical protein [Phaeodactylibacter sp.]